MVSEAFHSSGSSRIYHIETSKSQSTEPVCESSQCPMVYRRAVYVPLLFLLFINDLPNSSDIFKFSLFADDSSVSLPFKKSQSSIHLMINQNLRYINKYLNCNKIQIYISKLDICCFRVGQVLILNLFRSLLGRSFCVQLVGNFLGTFIDKYMNFTQHVNTITSVLKYLNQ